MIRQKKFFIKVLGSYVAVILVLSALLLVFTFRNIRTHYIDTLTEELQHLNYSLEAQLIPYLESGNIAQLDREIKALSRRIDTRLTVVDPDGVVLGDSDNDPGEMENHGYRAEIKTAYRGKMGRYIRFSKTMQETMLYVATPLYSDSEIIAVLRSSLFLSQVETLLRELRLRIFNITLIVILVVLIAILIYSNRMLRPITNLTDAAHMIAAGDFDTRVILKPKDDFHSLAEAFNLMTRKLRDSFSEISQQKEQLEAVLASVRAGLFVINKQGRIALYNEAFTALTQAQGIQGKYHWEVVRDPGLLNLINDIRESGETATREVSIDSKEYLCSASLIPATEDLVMIFHDITEVKRLQQLKKDFVVNISHELRTPLTAIKGFVETLQEDFIPENRRYLDIIGRHTERLINIVNDLLVLAEIEDRAQLQLEEIEPTQIRDRLSKLFAEHLKEKGLTLEWEIESQLKTFRADPFKLEQVFINLLDNAIKYTETGKIVVRCRRAERGIQIEVEDTGIGILEDQQSRIFERFYTVDKSRSRRLGGTGLGLSITRHIVLLHRGEIEVQSQVGKGTTFRIRLPNL